MKMNRQQHSNYNWNNSQMEDPTLKTFINITNQDFHSGPKMDHHSNIRSSINNDHDNSYGNSTNNKSTNDEKNSVQNAPISVMVFDPQHHESQSLSRISMDSDSKPMLAESTDSGSIIERLLNRIECLECELERIKNERDAMCSENERLCFKLQMINETDKQRSNHQTVDVLEHPILSMAYNDCQCNACSQNYQMPFNQQSFCLSKIPTTSESLVNNKTKPIVLFDKSNSIGTVGGNSYPQSFPITFDQTISNQSELLNINKDDHSLKNKAVENKGHLERSHSNHSLINHSSMNLSSTLQLSPTTMACANFFGPNSIQMASSNLSRTSRTTGGSTTSLTSNSNVQFNYEISQQLLDKKVSALERKYGGANAREAAIKIQRAYRSYKLQKRFTSLAIQASIHQKLKNQQEIQTSIVNSGKNGQIKISPNDLDNMKSVICSCDSSNYAVDEKGNSHCQILSTGTSLSTNYHFDDINTKNQNLLQQSSIIGCTDSMMYSQRTPSIIYNSGDGDQKQLQKTSFSSTSSTGGSSSSLHAVSSVSSKPSDRTSQSSKLSRNAAGQSNNNMSHNERNSQGQPPPIQQQKTLRFSKQYSQSQASVNNVPPVYKTSLSQCSGGTVMFTTNVEYANNSVSSSTTNEALVATVADLFRKRLYRVGLNLFNKTPSERGIRFLISHNFIEQFNTMEDQAKAVANFLLTRKGVSRQMIGEYLSENNAFNKAVLKAFAGEINLQGFIVDDALRSFQLNFRFPGEAQKIERIVEAFADRYKECNPNDVLSRDSIFILAFAIIMLNTDLHKPTNIKHRMTPEQWLNNLKGVFNEGDLSSQFLLGVYKRIKKLELQTGPDHVTQVLKVQSTIVGKDVPNLCLPHRRLVCYCRLYEIRDINRKEKNQHQRDVFLFNDLLLITKTTNRSRNNQLAEYQYRSCNSLDGLQVSIFSKGFYSYGIRISRRVDQKCITMFNARNDLDQKRFVEDLRESIAEMDEMEQIRITKSSSLVQLNNFMIGGSEQPVETISYNDGKQVNLNNSNRNNQQLDNKNSYSMLSSIPQTRVGSNITSNGHYIHRNH